MPDLQHVHPEVLRRFRAMEGAIRRAGYSLTITSGFRSTAEQARLFALRQAGKHPLPVAPPGCSEHNHGLALDAVTSVPQLYLCRLARFFGLVWAGPSDPVHYGVFSGAEWRRIRQAERLC